MTSTIHTPTVTPVVLCGGSGTRLWPLSRKSLPKQFVHLIHGKSLLNLTLERLKTLSSKVLLVASEEHRFLLADTLQETQTQGDLILEPFARNTAAAMGLAALWVQSQESKPSKKQDKKQDKDQSKGQADSPVKNSAQIHKTPMLTQASPLLLFCPSDHHIPDMEAFASSVALGIESAQAGAIVTFGVHPSSPSTAYGYIHFENPSHAGLLKMAKLVKRQEDLNEQQGSTTQTTKPEFAPSPGSASKVLSFVEKPDLETAQQYLLSGEYLWNAGIFLTRCDTLLNALALHAPDILEHCKEAMASPGLETVPRNTGPQLGLNSPMDSSLDSRFNSSFHSCFIRPLASSLEHCPSVSIDYAVMEHHQNTVVVPLHTQWSDVGSWNAVSDLTPKDNLGNQIEGQGLAVHAQNTFIHAPHRTVVALGVEDLLIIDTADALLVAHRDHAEGVKSVVSLLEKDKNPKALLHRKVHRPWGWYDSIDQGERFQVKRICVKAGASLSLQKHHHRAEHWIVVKGAAEVTKGEEIFLLGENQSTYIPIGEVHRLHNPGVTELEMIEVQSGSYLGEDDIVRLEDTYGRVKDKAE